jgi:integrase
MGAAEKAELPLDAGEKVFRLGKSAFLYNTLADASKAAGIEIPDGVAFHIFRHTYGAWVRRHAGLDTSGLVAAGAWKSRVAASVYERADVTAEAGEADLLPTPLGYMVVIRKALPRIIRNSPLKALP